MAAVDYKGAAAVIMMWASTTLGSVRDALFIYTTLFFETAGFSKIWHNNVGDQGGATQWGIASEFAPTVIAAKIRSKSLRLHDALVHIQHRYIHELARMGGSSWHRIDYRLAFVLFDSFFHGSLRQTTTWLQKECNERGIQLVVDGGFGPRTAAALSTLSPGQIESILKEMVTEAPTLGRQLALDTMASAARRGKQSDDWTTNFSERYAWKAKEALVMPRPA